VREIVRVLTYRIPALSDVAGQDLTLANIPEKLSKGLVGLGIGYGGVTECAAFLNSVQQMIEYGDQLDAMIQAQDGLIHFGDFILYGDARRTDEDTALARRMAYAKRGSGSTPISEEAQDWVVDGTPQNVEQNANTLLTKKGLFKFPLFTNPKSIIDVIKGKDVTLIEYHSPVMEVNSYLEFHIPLYVANVDFNGWFKFDGQFIIGYVCLFIG
jgi:hypothetical protein